MKKDLISSVNEYYNNYVSTLNTVRELERQNVQKEQELQKAAALNASGFNNKGVTSLNEIPSFGKSSIIAIKSLKFISKSPFFSIL